ncbi:MAG: hypothetical protein, partial [Olavius algarvensis Gamma 1 endosymbiont]
FHEQKDQKKAEQGTPIFAENPLRNRRTEPDQPSTESSTAVPKYRSHRSNSAIGKSFAAKANANQRKWV